jgi:hypothetical protein
MRLLDPTSSLTGAYSPEHDAARLQAILYCACRETLRQKTILFLRDDAVLLRGIVRRFADRRCVLAVERAIASMRESNGDWSGDVAFLVGCACAELVRFRDQLDDGDMRRNTLLWFIRKLRALRRVAGDAVHARVLARLAASAARRRA